MTEDAVVIHKNSNRLREELKEVFLKLKTVDLKRLLIDAVLWCILFGFTVFGLSNAGAIQQRSAISLRYETPFSGQAAYEARQYAIERREENTFWQTFWIETVAKYSVEYNEVTAHCIIFSGDASRVWPVEDFSGGMPGVTDDIGCAVSSGLAFELWGDVDVIGKTLDVDGTSRIVRSVFYETHLLALVSARDEDLAQSYDAVELSGGNSTPDRESVERFAAASGLGVPDSVLMGTPGFFAWLAAALPVVIVIVYRAAAFINRMRKCSAAIRRIFVFLLPLCVAVLIPGILEALPDWIIPTLWSDFSFWGSLFRQTGDNLREYLKLSPSLRDTGYAVLVFKQIFLAFPASGFAIFICFRLHGSKVRTENNFG